MTTGPEIHPRPLESYTLGKVIDSMTARLASVPPDDPTARLLREQLEETTALRDSVAAREADESHSHNSVTFPIAIVVTLVFLAAAGFAAYEIATPGHSLGPFIGLLAGALVFALLFGGIATGDWHELSEYRARRAQAASSDQQG